MLRLMLPAVLAILAGISVLIQQTLNSSLHNGLNSAVWSGFTSYAVGLGCMILLVIAVREPIPSIRTLSGVPWWLFTGGLFGAIFIVVAIFLLPQLGAANFFVLFVAGQMLASLLFDHFGWLGLAQRSISAPRVIGVVLLIGGCVLIRR